MAGKSKFCSSPDLKTALLSTKLLAQLASCQSPGPQLLNESQLQSVISALLSIVTDDKSLPAVAEEAALGIAQIAGTSIISQPTSFWPELHIDFGC